jgi:hypothetical protein
MAVTQELTKENLGDAIKAAHAAGNTDDVKVLAREYKNRFMSSQKNSGYRGGTTGGAFGGSTTGQNAYKKGSDASENKNFKSLNQGIMGQAVDSAQSLLGKGVEVVGSTLGLDSVEDYGRKVNEYNEKQMATSGYKSAYTDSFLDTLDKNGWAGAAGWVREKTLENSATSGVALGGTALTALTAMFSAPAALVVGTSTLAGSALLGTGEAASEIEDMGGRENDPVSLGVGAIIGILDKFGAGKVIPKGQLAKLSVKSISDKLIESGMPKVAVNNVVTRLVRSATFEAGTEAAQEGLILAGGAARGDGRGEYTFDMVKDRLADAAAVGTGSAATVGTGVETASALSSSAQKLMGMNNTMENDPALTSAFQRLSSLRKEDGTAFNLQEVNADGEAWKALTATQKDINADIQAQLRILKENGYINVKKKGASEQEIKDVAIINEAIKAAKNEVKQNLTEQQLDAIDRHFSQPNNLESSSGSTPILSTPVQTEFNFDGGVLESNRTVPKKGTTFQAEKIDAITSMSLEALNNITDSQILQMTPVEYSHYSKINNDRLREETGLKPEENASKKPTEEQSKAATVEFNKIKPLSRESKSRVKATEINEATDTSEATDKRSTPIGALSSEATDKGSTPIGALSSEATDKTPIEALKLKNLILESNALTQFRNQGIVGGLSQFTDKINPLARASRGSNPQDGTAATNKTILAGAGLLYDPTLFTGAVGAVAGSRIIDKITGRRSKVARGVKLTKNKQGLTLETNSRSAVEENKAIALKKEQKKILADIKKLQKEAANASSALEKRNKDKEIAAAKKKTEKNQAKFIKLGLRHTESTDDAAVKAAPMAVLFQALNLVNSSNSGQQLENNKIVFDTIKAAGKRSDVTGLTAEAATQAVKDLKGGKTVLELPLVIKAAEKQAFDDGSLNSRQLESNNTATETTTETEEKRYDKSSAAGDERVEQISQSTPPKRKSKRQEGKEANQAFAQTLIDDVGISKISAGSKVLIRNELKKLTGNRNLGDPVAAMEAMMKRLQDKKVSKAAIDKYVRPYADMVFSQQNRRAKRVGTAKTAPTKITKVGKRAQLKMNLDG